ncbi:MAG: hypothetical protein ACD_23C00974G0003 [uncultured bacterium]|nr:MAG: hypothetical protein ACD_23C00974G0003 [uncultured bacterium]
MAAMAELCELRQRQLLECCSRSDGCYLALLNFRFWPNPDPWLPAVGSLCNTIGMMQGQLPIFTRVPDSQYVGTSQKTENKAR